MPKILVFMLCLGSIAFGQKREIDHTAYNLWKRIESQQISKNGLLTTYTISPLRGDVYLYIYNKLTEKIDSFARAKDPKIAWNESFVAFKITPGFDTLRKCELQKMDKKKWPKDSLAIFYVKNDSLVKFPLLKSFDLSDETSWLCYLKEDNNTPSSKNNLKRRKRIRKNTEPTYKSDGKILTLIPTHVDSPQYFKDVLEYQFSEKGNYLSIVQHQKHKTDSAQLLLIDLQKNTTVFKSTKYNKINHVTFSKEDELLAFLSSKDTSENKLYTLNILEIKSNTLTIIDTSNTQIPKTKSISEHRSPMFLANSNAIYFGLGDLPKKEEKDTLLESEKVKLDIWHYRDERLQSQQLVELKNDKKKSDLWMYHFKNKSLIPLSNDTLRVHSDQYLKSKYTLGTVSKPYMIQSQWEGQHRRDLYRVNTENGANELLRKNVFAGGDLSPLGEKFTYFDEVKKNQFLIDLKTQQEYCITCSLPKVEWLQDLNGLPSLPEPFEIYGYTKNEEQILLQSKYDLYAFQVKTKELKCLTKSIGEINKIRFELYKWEKDSVFFDLNDVYVIGFDEKTKNNQLYRLVENNNEWMPELMNESKHKLSIIARSENKEVILYKKMSLREYPELRWSNNYLKTERILSITNPQQVQYNWANVELVKWKNYKGLELEGLLYTPEDFDSTKNYPLLVYYYELHSDDFHNHFTPKPSASTINPLEYASSGYVVFMPDIRYQVGHPAQSAYDCIMSGTDYILKLLPNIDAKRMGLQGQSWGGYQTAQLITMTNRYAAAMAGAPVANMFSAYGGIRWGTGLNRQFQYETGQSRIGKTIWEAPELYLENSPLFHLPKIQTPLLIMHNDADGAVPWYQGIELFTAMRRLQKPCWMLNYNGDDHNLLKNANRIDLSIRMKQFFNHYLKNEPAPEWLLNGIPALDKGEKNGY